MINRGKILGCKSSALSNPGDPGVENMGLELRLPMIGQHGERGK
jgi:hypothetical protein